VDDGGGSTSISAHIDDMAMVTPREDHEVIREIYETLSSSAGLTIHREKVAAVREEGHSLLGLT